MRIAQVDLYYLAMPEIRDIGDGSQDALLVRVTSETGEEGWGECEASPLPSIAAWCAPMSHSACKPVRDSVIGRPVDGPHDIYRITHDVRQQSLDLLQADHTLSGVDMALWDLLGKKREEPVWKLLGWQRSYPKTAYASALFGDTPEETRKKGHAIRDAGYLAAKFGWGPYGMDPRADAAQVRAAREGVGPDVLLMIDAGTVWGEDVDKAIERLPVLVECDVTWIEEPFVSGALGAYRELARRARDQGAGRLKTAAGEGSHDPFMARNLIDYGDVGYIQIDAGRIGGLTSAYEVARYAEQRAVSYVNHTFTTPLAMSASLQPYAGLERSFLCEYPVEASPLAAALTVEPLDLDQTGRVLIPDRPGLGMTPNPHTINRYLQEMEIVVNGAVVYTSPEPLQLPAQEETG